MQSIPAEILLLTGGICYIVWWIINSPSGEGRFFILPAVSANSPQRIFLKRLLGVLFFFMIPFTLALILLPSQVFSWLEVSDVSSTFLVSLALSVPLILISLLTGKKPENLAMYPEIKATSWNSTLIAGSALSWMAYLFAYEFMFRGCMFFPLINSCSFPLAMVINSLIYSFAHFPKSFRETMGALPLGAAMCWACYHTGNIWPAVAGHVSLALSNEWTAIYAATKEQKVNV